MNVQDCELPRLQTENGEEGETDDKESEGGQVVQMTSSSLREEKISHAPSNIRLQHTVIFERSLTHTHTQLYRQLPRKQLLSDAPRPLPILLINN